MDQAVLDVDAFAIPDLWQKSKLVDFEDNATYLITKDLRSLGTVNSLEHDMLSALVSCDV